jgi:hypothetical protein
MTGQIKRAAVYEQTDKQTFVQITIEPVGSRFIIFRQKHAHSSPNVESLTRAGKEILPDPTKAIAEPPAMEFTADARGRVEALVWQDGHYVLHSSSAADQGLDIKLPSPLELRVPWEVHFQSGRGAPDHLTFDQLMDWSRHPDPGVRYFSGSAIYTTTFSVPDPFLGTGQRAYLDLGDVAVMAQVKLNGTDLGTLWKPPYRVDATHALKPGQNQLEVKVVNLWINRMIGDEQLPEDCDRNSNGTLKKWPAWLDTDQPSPTGRYTFTSWRLWKKDSPLQTSGLLGPVRVVPAVLTTIK